MTSDEQEARREAALGYALRLGERHDKIESRLLQLETFLMQTGLTDDEHRERKELWAVHDRLEREVLIAYAQLNLIDPEAVEWLRDGEDV